MLKTWVIHNYIFVHCSAKFYFCKVILTFVKLEIIKIAEDLLSYRGNAENVKAL
jgi:hypothetical protein